MSTDPSDEARFERMLRARRAELDDDSAAVDARLEALGAMRDANTDDEHDPDGAPVSAEWSRLTGIRLEADRERAATDAALARIAAGTFGTCESCGRPIATARLEARPTATLCIECAALIRRP
ncbi:TraR/DksA family transcriptional regulator [Gryllotalpicola reticulitermitis]|uniref:TraR/DksA family transcriptional regulator n=1 Tax=Gryllotalpicola reticulitermitis TaxID=1184153 RepID=A0ABV8Q7V8_9MICO